MNPEGVCSDSDEDEDFDLDVESFGGEARGGAMSTTEPSTVPKRRAADATHSLPRVEPPGTHSLRPSHVGPRHPGYEGEGGGRGGADRRHAVAYSRQL